jgi:hypothetical protein
MAELELLRRAEPRLIKVCRLSYGIAAFRGYSRDWSRRRGRSP